MLKDNNKESRNTKKHATPKEHCHLASPIKISAKQVARPNHQANTLRLNRVRGQIDAVIRMINEEKYCMDIVQQIKAATSALKGVEKEVMRGHLRGCVREAMENSNAFEVQEKIEEIVDLWA